MGTVAAIPEGRSWRDGTMGFAAIPAEGSSIPPGVVLLRCETSSGHTIGRAARVRGDRIGLGWGFCC
jgi:hypothetical protein